MMGAHLAAVDGVAVAHHLLDEGMAGLGQHRLAAVLVHDIQRVPGQARVVHDAAARFALQEHLGQQADQVVTLDEGAVLVEEAAVEVPRPTRGQYVSTRPWIGLAWDRDFDRCFFFDESRPFIEGYYLVGLLAEVFLKRERRPHRARPAPDLERARHRAHYGGKTVLSKSGHAFIKQVMRDCDGAYGGEMSAHHYFRDFAYADSGMIPWLIVLQVISETGKSLSQLVGERMRLFPASGEINRKLAPEKGGAKAVLARAEAHYKSQAKSVDYTDGLSMEFDQWRFNIRASNTEPLVRLNVESRADERLMKAKTAELLALMDE